jgi:hypothetical protein
MRPRRMRRRFAAAAIVTVGVCALSCSDSTAPATPVTLPPFGSAEAAAVDSLWASALFASVSGASHAFEGFRTIQGTSLFADSELGATFTYDCTASRYIHDTTLGGAPLSGVRLETYWVTDTYYPSCPLFPLAHLDFADQSDTAPALDVVVRDLIPGIEHMRVMVRAPRSGTGGPFTVSGMISDGVRHYTIAGSLDHSISVNHHSAVTLTRIETGAVLRTTMDVHDSLAAGVRVGVAQDVDLTVTREGHEVRVSGAYALCDSCGFWGRSLRVLVDGRSFGTIASQLDSYTFTGPGGRSMTPSEEEAVSWLQTAIFNAEAVVSTTTDKLTGLLPQGAP